MKPCQFHLLGRCNKGSSCTFSHDPSVCRPGGAGTLCRDFTATGICRNGDRCVFVHRSGAQPDQAYFYGKKSIGDSDDLVGIYGEAPISLGSSRSAAVVGRTSAPSTSWAKVARLPSQVRKEEEAQFAQSAEKKPDPREGTHPDDAVESLAQQFSKSTSTPAARKIPCRFFFSSSGCRAGDSCRFSHDPQQVPLSRIEGHDSQTCGICFDDLRFKRIGILTHCDHLFCLGCIRGWRASEMSELERTKENVQTCPVCRVRSHFVVPSDSIPSTPEDKKRMVDTYREQCAKIPCKYKDNECPFGSSCMFYHNVVDPAKLGLRFAKTAEGGDRALSSKVATLGDFILK